MACIAFATDYGLADGFVAACHGVARTLAPHAALIDVTHAIPPGDVARGARLLAEVAPYLPPGTVCVAVVDPGVGTARRAVAVEAASGVLVGPDNGLLLPAADALGGARRAVELTDARLFRHPVSATFHGRDVFTPVAAHLAGGLDLAAAGTAVGLDTLARLPGAVVRRGERRLEAEVVGVDRFGNVQLAAGPDDLPLSDGTGVTVDGGTAGAVAAVRGRTFGDVDAGRVVVLVDAAGRLAVAVRGGRASDVLGAAPGDVLCLVRAQGAGQTAIGSA